MKIVIEVDRPLRDAPDTCYWLMKTLQNNGFPVTEIMLAPDQEKTDEKKPFDNVDARVLAAAAQQYSVNLGLEMARASLRIAQQALKDSNEELQKAKLARKARDGY